MCLEVCEWILCPEHLSANSHGLPARKQVSVIHTAHIYSTHSNAPIMSKLAVGDYYSCLNSSDANFKWF